jgi:hypothetical protein
MALAWLDLLARGDAQRTRVLDLNAIKNETPSMRYRLRTLLILMAVGPPLMAWHVGGVIDSLEDWWNALMGFAWAVVVTSVVSSWTIRGKQASL